MSHKDFNFSYFVWVVVPMLGNTKNDATQKRLLADMPVGILQKVPNISNEMTYSGLKYDFCKKKKTRPHYPSCLLPF
jgi:hypothetical protein